MISPSDAAALAAALTGKGLSHPRYAVALPLVNGAQVSLLMEVRARCISQAGDPCFPGGRIEPGETPARAAARELREELGIEVDPEAFLGRLPTVDTVLGRQTDIFVCVISTEQAAAASPNPHEVEVLLRPNLEFFLRRPNDSSYPVSGHTVWGMTAGAVRHLCRAWRRAMGEETRLRDEI